MRVKHYISIVLISSVMAASAFAALVVLTLRAEQEAMRDSGRASNDFRNVALLDTAIKELLAVLDILTAGESGVELIAHRAVVQCRSILAELGSSKSFVTVRRKKQ